MPRKARIDAPGALHHIILRGTSMTLGGVLTGEQVRLQAFDGGGCWDLTEKKMIGIYEKVLW